MKTKLHFFFLSSIAAFTPLLQQVPAQAQLKIFPNPNIDTKYLRYLIQADDPVYLGGASNDINGFAFNWSAADLEVLRLTNAERQKYGLPRLRLSKKLSIAAMCHAKDLAEHDNFYVQPGVDVHAGSDGSSTFSRVTRAGYQPSYWGENVYDWSPTISAANAVNWWMSSPSHRANILNPNYTEIGIGYSLVHTSNRHRYVQDFGTPQPGSSSVENVYCS